MSALTRRARIAAEAIGPALNRAGWTLATAESCTGGLVGHLITQVSGCSVYYRGGVISYDNAIKQSLLGVTADDLRDYGAVSEEVAAQMARGVGELLHADVGISVTGIAGPLGGTRAKPVGTVYIGLCLPEGEFVEHHVWDSDREGNKLLSAVAALEMLAETIVVDWP
jgi:PncC family amidohydrolase